MNAEGREHTDEDRASAHREHQSCPRGEHSWTDHLPGREREAAATECSDPHCSSFPGVCRDPRHAPEVPLMHDPVNMLLADTYARRHGFKDFLDARPLELLKIIVDDVRAIREALDEAGYEVSRRG